MSSPSTGRPSWRPSTRTALLLSLVAVVIAGLVADRFANGPRVLTGSPTPGPIGATPVAGEISSGNPTSPPTTQPVPTGDAAAPAPCTRDDLAVSAWGWGGATGSLAGGATVINVAPEPCRLGGKPHIALFARRGGAIATGGRAEPGRAGDWVDLAEGDFARITTVWMNWCRRPPTRPLFLRLSLPGGAGDLETRVRERAGSSTTTPRCDVRDVPSTIGVPKPFAAPEPPEPGVAASACRASALAGYLGPWGAGLGNFYASSFVLNGGGFDCLLPAAPPLELRDAGGHRLLTAEQSQPASTIVLPAGWVAVARLDFANWCIAQPRLPFAFDLVIGSAVLKLRPVSANSEIGPPSCMTSEGTPPPILGYDSPFAIPGSSDE